MVTEMKSWLFLKLIIYNAKCVILYRNKGLKEGRLFKTQNLPNFMTIDYCKAFDSRTTYSKLTLN